MQPQAPISDDALDVPLAVDLDGTLVRTDTLHENLLVLLKHAPWLLLLVPLWVLRGKAFFKAEVARRAPLDVTSLPYNADVLAFLREEHARGRRLVLATAADRSIADAVAAHLGLFHTVVASEGGVNLSGARKLERLRELLGRFDYAGNDAVDLHLWRECRQIIVVHAPAGVLRQVQGLGRPVHRVFEAPPGGLRPWVKALRVHQWAKNALVFVPVLAAHKATQGGMAPRAVLAFLAFSLCASSVYIINDLLDLASDRRHPSKSLRPFASGALPVRAGVVLAPLLLVAAAALALATLPLSFFGLLAAYFVLTLAYSLRLKQVVMLDVLVLAGLYTVRIFGGALAVGVPTSSWLLMFSTFLFLSLALLKRLSEVRRLRQSNETSAHGRGYLAQDQEQLASLGAASGQVSVLVLALYITSKEVTALYAHPERLWLLCPVMLYWVGRIWLLAHRGLVNEDPLVFALRDRVSYVVGAVAALVLWVAT
ncbi:UbiA family prenyltransferase [Corallococcus sp. AB011P]|uniref:UbiA family prenyltransferase n=1 Tax=unclassified Corallococcus TaxID=2685029 RepID=UPI000EA2BE33|nr:MULTISPECIES: UbiA family prenyltransferase [unclassified Corallococcus]RKG58365.1 UbiA family prenyltransferase [Corallococcus sp. AB011P]RKH88191.1 UbiA family prenyltransferase [Corallococcus sp. AB045]